MPPRSIAGYVPVLRNQPEHNSNSASKLMLTASLVMDAKPLPYFAYQPAPISDSTLSRSPELLPSNPSTIPEEHEQEPILTIPRFKLFQTPSRRKADNNSPSSVVAGSLPPTLPPSVEEAYKKKCIELKRRLQEVEETSDTFRLRKVRLMRGIRKMRLERAFLLETLGKRMKKNGSGINGMHRFYDEDSEGSSEGPPTVRKV